MATAANSIPSKLLKSTKTILDNCLIKAEFPNKLKLANITPRFKKEGPSRAKNCRPVCGLPSISKVFERILHRQVSSYVD